MPSGANAGSSSGAPTGSAGGSLTGTYPNPTIATIPSGATATTQSAADGSTKVATTAYVDTADALKANLASPTFSGTPSLPTGTTATTQSAADSTTKLATTAFTTTADNLKANLASPTFTGTVVLPDSTVTSAMITDATIVNADVSATAGILASKTFDREYYLNGKTFMRSTMVREAVRDAAGAAPGTAVMMSVPIVLYVGDVITNVIFETGTTAAGTSPTHWWFALYDTQATPALIAQTTDQTSTAWAATTVKTLALGSPAPYTVVTSGVHWVSVMMANAVTMPTFLGAILTASGATGTANQVMLCQTSGSSLTTTAPGTITGGTVKNAVPYARVT